MPGVPCEALSGLAFSQATNSFRSLAGNTLFVVISIGLCAIKATGSKSLETSYFSAKVAPLTTCVLQVPKLSV